MNALLPFRFIRHAPVAPSCCLFASLLCAALCSPFALYAGTPEHEARPAAPAPPPSARTSADRTGVLQTRDGLTLRVAADLGSVRVTSLEPGAPPVVRYTVHLETDAHAPLAQHLLDHYSLTAKATPSGVEINGALPPQTSRPASGAQFWVQFELAVPPGYNVEISTLAGDIETQDIGGTAALITQGGNIHAGKIGFGGIRGVVVGHRVAKLETQGGHIQVLDVAGDLNAFTAGGHIIAGNIAGDAVLRSGGGHIRAGQIGGRAELDTDGGNITVGKAGSVVNVRTGGGQIDFGEVRGSVRAQTGGGGIRVMYVSGPMEVESSGGSICLTRVAGAVQAATSGGTITAWINPDAPAGNGPLHLGGSSQLTSGNGDIVVFLPRTLAATIEASVAAGGSRHIEADPAMHLVMQGSGNGAGPLHATAVLNGGGAPLKLRTTAGRIRLQFLDSEIALHESLLREQRERINRALPGLPVSLREPCTPADCVQPPGSEPKGDWLESMLDSLELFVTGGLREDPDEFQKRIISAPKPEYPALAQRAGIQGRVRLEVRVTKDGHVEVQRLLEGEPVLADAAMAAVKQWQANPVWVKGKKVEVISTVTFNFQLH